MRSKPLLPIVPVDLDFTDEEFSAVLSTCDPSTARLGEGFLDAELGHLFDNEMHMLLRDARKAWV